MIFPCHPAHCQEGLAVIDGQRFHAIFLILVLGKIDAHGTDICVHKRIDKHIFAGCSDYVVQHLSFYDPKADGFQMVFHGEIIPDSADKLQTRELGKADAVLFI